MATAKTSKPKPVLAIQQLIGDKIEKTADSLSGYYVVENGEVTEVSLISLYGNFDLVALTDILSPLPNFRRLSLIMSGMGDAKLEQLSRLSHLNYLYLSHSSVYYQLKS
jgi:hypothetical protein